MSRKKRVATNSSSFGLSLFEILEDRRKDQQQGINPLLKIVTVREIRILHRDRARLRIILG